MVACRIAFAYALAWKRTGVRLGGLLERLLHRRFARDDTHIGQAHLDQARWAYRKKIEIKEWAE